MAIAPRSYSWTLLFDGECGFCKWSLAWVLRLDRHRRLRVVALADPEAAELLADLPLAAREASWHLLAPDGRRYSAGAAAPPLLRLLPGGPLPAALLAGAPVTTERAYRWIAEHRGALGRALPQRSKTRAAELIKRRTNGS